MKIIHVIPNLRKGGAERIVLNICTEIQAQNEHDILLITFQPDNAYTFLTENLNWKVVPSDVIPSITGKAEINVSELQSTIDDFQPDVIHAHLFKTMMVLSQITNNSAKLFLHFHDNMFQLERFSWSKLFQKSMWTNLYEKQLIYRVYNKRNVTAIAISDDTLRYANKVLPNKIEVIKLLNAIDRERFFSEAKRERSNRIVMIGSLVEKKNQRLAIETIDELRTRGIHLSLDLVGDGILRQDLEDHVQTKDLIERVTFHGAVNYPEQILEKALIYIHTSKVEAFGLVLVEAMSAGLPVVCTDGGGNRDLILEGKNGFMVNEFSTKLLADKVEYLIKHPGKRVVMGKNAQEFSRKFDISSYTKKLIELYKRSQRSA